MSSHVERIEIQLQCARCLRRITWAWLITYKSYRYTQLVYVCSECGSVIRVSKAARQKGNAVNRLIARGVNGSSCQTMGRKPAQGVEL